MIKPAPFSAALAFVATTVFSHAPIAVSAPSVDNACNHYGNILKIVQNGDMAYQQRHSSLKAIYEGAGTPANDDQIDAMLNLPEAVIEDGNDWVSKGCPDPGSPVPTIK
ncbi:MAG: hypothetical protein H6853_07650 [Rhodospirillales bacterium]|nr:hypothetical protein [Alphaproteobacteria bacterium]USO03394.1 MAG: hypothetical protein H6853_07650 [Rhodospirillales bacterium]